MSETPTPKAPNIIETMFQSGGEAMRGLKLPPPVFVEMGTEVVSFDPQTNTLVCKFPVQERWQNPLGYMQGGVLAVLVDNTVGPLSFMVAPPSVTTQMNISYFRPVTPEESEVTVTAQLSERTRKQLFFTATVRGSDGKTLCVANATQQILG